MQDNKPLFSTSHPRVWGFKTRFKLLNRFLDFVWFLFHRPKLTESNLGENDFGARDYLEATKGLLNDKTGVIKLKRRKKYKIKKLPSFQDPSTSG